ncbi:hypothetical protein [Herbaspirillum sp. RV1423]|uniref:hypothetical protein n=1 Tax=Herbaspirillum sp. RV1423 TaxID=1443993 RepID=UPI0004AF91E6|nr:hypothetical protein [Herbaspirillum sp. RV1423]
MKYAFRLLALASAMTTCTASNAGDAPFDVSTHIEQNVPIIQLEAATDQVVLTGFNVNRGNCKAKLGGVYPLPLTFKFGQGVKLFAYSCKVKEVVLTTDQGNYTYSFR